MEEDIRYLELALNKIDEVKVSLIETNPVKYAELKQELDDHLDFAWYAAYRLLNALKKEEKGIA